MTLGSRFDHNSVFGEVNPPKAGVNVRVTDQFRARFHPTDADSAPPISDSFSTASSIKLNPSQGDGNPHLRPEKANSLQLGGEFTSRICSATQAWVFNCVL